MRMVKGLVATVGAALLTCGLVACGGSPKATQVSGAGLVVDITIAMGIADLDHVFAIDELAHGDVMFAATGVTDGFLLRAVSDQTTEVDGQPVERGAEAPIRPGTVVRLARTMTLRFMAPAEPVVSDDATMGPMPPR